MKQKLIDIYANVLPDEAVAELLHLTFAEEFDPDRFLRWISEIELDDADDGLMRLLPTLYPRLKQTNVNHRYVPRIAGIYRHTTYRNRLLMHKGMKVIEALRTEGFDSMLLKGAAILCLEGVDPGSRPMADFDILLRENADIVTIERIGREVLGSSAHVLAKSQRVLSMSDENGFEIDFHWHLRDHSVFPGSTAKFWQNPIQARWRDVKCNIPALECQVFSIILHGLAYNSVSPVRWISDALTVLNCADDFNWQVLVDLSAQYGASEPIAVGLHCLETFVSTGDREAVAKGMRLLELQKGSWRDNLYMRSRAWLPRHKRLQKVASLYLEFDLLMRLNRTPASISSFEAFLSKKYSTKSFFDTASVTARYFLRGSAQGD